MEPLERHDLRARTQMLSDSRFVRAIIAGGLLCLFGAVVVANELVLVFEFWRWRVAQPSTATVVLHRVEPIAFDPSFGFPSKYRHEIKYTYVAAGEDYVTDLQRDWGSKDSIFLDGRERDFVEGSTFGVWYLTHSPEDHWLFVDPSKTFWQSAAHLGVFAAGALMVLLIVAFYKPRDRGPRRVMPATLQLPTAEEAVVVNSEVPPDNDCESPPIDTERRRTEAPHDDVNT